MNPILSLDQMVDHVRSHGRKCRVAVAYAQDPNTIGAIARAIHEGFIDAIMIGDADKIAEESRKEQIDPSIFTTIHIPDDVGATREAVRMVRDNEADVLMKGLVDTSKFLKAVMDKNTGLLPPNAVMSYVCALEVPQYHKLLFVTDTAVIPFPDLQQKIAMIHYGVDMARQFGISKPKVALLSASEKVSVHFEDNVDYAMICKMVDRKQINDCIIDGPLDLFLACDKKSVEIKNVQTPIDGDADVLIFPNIEASNTFYKGMMLFGHGELAGLIQGTTKPVVVMSRSESAKSKFYCVVLSCLMAEKNN